MATKKTPEVEEKVEEVALDERAGAVTYDEYMNNTYPFEMVTVRYPAGRGRDEQDLFIRVNEKTWLIKRDEWVTIPYFVKEIADRQIEMLRKADKYAKGLEEKPLSQQ